MLSQLELVSIYGGVVGLGAACRNIHGTASVGTRGAKVGCELSGRVAYATIAFEEQLMPSITPTACSSSEPLAACWG